MFKYKFIRGGFCSPEETSSHFAGGGGGGERGFKTEERKALTGACDCLHLCEEVHQDQGDCVQIDICLKRTLTHQLYYAVYVALSLQREVRAPAQGRLDIET